MFLIAKSCAILCAYLDLTLPVSYVEMLYALLQVQNMLLTGSWDSEILQLPNCQVEMQGDKIIWHGVRVKMGICEGMDGLISLCTSQSRTACLHQLGTSSCS